MISEEKFYDKGKDFALLKNTKDEFYTLEEYKEHIKTNQTDKEGNFTFLYTTDAGKQDTFVQAALKRGYDVLKLGEVIDSHLYQYDGAKARKSEPKACGCRCR